MQKILVPVVTAFDDKEKPCAEGNARIADFLVSGGVDGILILGSTGEFTNLTPDDKERMLVDYAKAVDGRVELYAGTACPDWHDTVALSNRALDLGYAASLVIGPSYYAISQDELFAYYDAIASGVRGPLYIYNFPARTGHSIAPETLARLVEAHDNIRGLKDSVTEPMHTAQLALAVEGSDFKLYSGYDDQFLYNRTINGAGGVGATANLAPEVWRDLVDSANAGDMDRACELAGLVHRLMQLYSLNSNCSLLFKQLMVHRGVEIDPRAIFPFNDIDEDVYERGERLLDGVLADYRKMARQ